MLGVEYGLLHVFYFKYSTSQPINRMAMPEEIAFLIYICVVMKHLL